MAILHSFTLATTVALALAACAQNPVAGRADEHAAHQAAAAGTPSPAPTDRMARMDAHMKAMRDLHDRMSRAATAQERQALMEQHMKLMHEGMAMMEGMRHGGMGGMGGMAQAPCKP